MKILNYVGICITILGAIILGVCFASDYVDNNLALGGGALTIIIGIIAHYFVNRITPKYDSPEAPIGSGVVGIVTVLAIVLGVGLSKALIGDVLVNSSAKEVVETLAANPDRCEEFGLWNPPADAEELLSLDQGLEAATSTTTYGLLSVIIGIVGAALFVAIWLGIVYLVNVKLFNPAKK